LTAWHWAAVRPSRDSADHGSGLPNPATVGSTCVLVLPPHRVSWHTVQLPKTAAGKWRAALEGLLEERLLDDPAQLHFALPAGFKPLAGAPASWVAVCDRAWLKACLQALNEAGLTVTRILPATPPLAQPTAWAHDSAGEPWISCMSPQGVVHWPIGRAAIAMDDGSAQAAFALRAPMGWHHAAEAGQCFTTPAAAQRAETWLEGAAWQMEPAWKQWLRAADTDWDLAQFDIRLSAGARREKSLRDAWHSALFGPAWRPLRRGAVGLALVHMVGLNAVAWQQEQALNTLRQTAQSTLTDTFPHVTLVLDAPLQMQRELERLRQGRGGLSAADLEPWLQTWEPLARRHGVDLLRLDFAPTQVTLEHTPLSAEARTALQAAWSDQGWRAEFSGNSTTLSRGGRP
jgi:general secretion pathway protein L